MRPTKYESDAATTVQIGMFIPAFAYLIYYGSCIIILLHTGALSMQRYPLVQLISVAMSQCCHLTVYVAASLSIK